jgi:hypothetical protein
MNSNWPRWIYASVTQHFAVSTSYKTFVEGEPRMTWAEKDFIEIRMDGPYFTMLDSSTWEAMIEVNILLQSVIDLENLHKIHTMAGIVASAFSTGLQIFKYGSGPLDDQSLLACAELLQDKRNKQILAISHFGQIAPDKPLQQASVEGHFKIQL